MASILAQILFWCLPSPRHHQQLLPNLRNLRYPSLPRPSAHFLFLQRQHQVVRDPHIVAVAFRCEDIRESQSFRFRR